MGVRIGRPSEADIDAVLTAAGQADFSYPARGTTLSLRGECFQRDVGAGTDAFAAASDALRHWVPQRALGATVHPPDAVPNTGTTIVVALHYGPFTIIAPNRVVSTVDEPRRRGFAYGTLPGHPERGEEAFIVEHLDDDRVIATICVDAGPAMLLARFGAALVTVLQRRAIRSYLDAIANHVAVATDQTRERRP